MQTRQDLHRRHAREREALETQTATLQQRIQSMQAAEKSQSATKAAATSALQDVKKLTSENASLRERVEVSQRELKQNTAPLASIQAENKQLQDTVAQLQKSLQLQSAQGSSQQQSLHAAELKVLALPPLFFLQARKLKIRQKPAQVWQTF